MKYAQFRQRHPSYDADTWNKIRALYEGGPRLLEDKKTLESLFPPHLYEQLEVYEERKKRAFYTPYLGQIVDFIVAGLGLDPCEVSAEPELDDDYKDFLKDTSRPGGDKMPWNLLLCSQARTALLLKRAWTLVDLPEKSSDLEIQSRADEVAAGLDQAYAMAIVPEQVIDWEEDDDGSLSWALICRQTAARDGLAGNRNTIREEFTFYTPKAWERYAIEWDKEKKPDGPEDEDEVELIAGPKPHSFGRVPLIPFEVKPGLWAGGKLLHMAREHFNRRCALSWGHYRSAFAFLAAFLGPPDALNPITEDTNRAINQRLGPGRMMVLGEKDRLEFKAPDSAPFSVAAEDLSNIRDEMMRVMHSMAQSVDNSGAALQRSAASKQVDQTSTAVIFKALGAIARDHGEDILDAVAAGRGEAEKYEFQLKGLESFDELSAESQVEEAALAENIAIPSPTFQSIYKYKIARALISTEASDEELDTIRDELETASTAEAELDKARKDDELDTIENPPEPAPVVVAPGAPPVPGNGAPPAPKKKAPPPKGAKA